MMQRFRQRVRARAQGEQALAQSEGTTITTPSTTTTISTPTTIWTFCCWCWYCYCFCSSSCSFFLFFLLPQWTYFTTVAATHNTGHAVLAFARHRLPVTVLPSLPVPKSPPADFDARNHRYQLHPSVGTEESADVTRKNHLENRYVRPFQLLQAKQQQKQQQERMPSSVARISAAPLFWTRRQSLISTLIIMGATTTLFPSLLPSLSTTTTIIPTVASAATTTTAPTTTTHSDSTTFTFTPPPGFLVTAGKPLKTHLQEVQYQYYDDSSSSSSSSSSLFKSVQLGITVDPVRINSLQEFGSAEQVAAKVVSAELQRSNQVTSVTLMTDPQEVIVHVQNEDPTDTTTTTTTTTDTTYYVLNYRSSRRNRKVPQQQQQQQQRFICKLCIAQHKLYVLTAQCPESIYNNTTHTAVAHAIQRAVDSFQVISN